MEATQMTLGDAFVYGMLLGMLVSGVVVAVAVRAYYLDSTPHLPGRDRWTADIEIIRNADLEKIRWEEWEGQQGKSTVYTYENPGLPVIKDRKKEETK